ncbi:TorF family putative porin [Litorivivens sp.]|uniref:TorF family putative porin n=1 Tax=Litorivivens sp. TaxID=2020868 RepID=UPI0035699D27
MKKVKTLLTSGATAAAIALSAAPAMAELEASAAVSSQYLFRGIDQGGGGAVSGDLIYSTGGFYVGAWISSLGSSLGGSEIDTFAGWAGEFGGLGVDIGVLDYYYPGTNGAANAADDWGKGLTEAYIGLSFAGVELYYWDQISGKSTALDDNSYTSLSYGMGKFSALVGFADFEEPSAQTYDSDYTHLDITYSYNDNLSFTLSKIVDMDDEINSNKAASGYSGTADDDLQFVVSYSIPLM